jgi:DNA-binding winged helix-turn-helix (wHTH) protein
MGRNKIYVFGILASLFFIFWGCSEATEDMDDFSEIVKISLRDVGNQLLLSNQDGSSLIYPVVEIDKSRFKLSFESELSMNPDTLVSIVKNSFKKAELPEKYRVEVIQCSDEEVAYSYQVKKDIEKDIIPCGGRFLPSRCYMIEVHFIHGKSTIFGQQTPLYTSIIVFLGLLTALFYRKKKGERVREEQKIIAKPEASNYTSIGSFKFYEEQSKLVKAAVEIGLSKKECELLVIFVANPNQVIKRDELTKRVWEDNGVIVGRSLDTYISKLRKILKDDDTVKIVNVHGVGYKLEVRQI